MDKKAVFLIFGLFLLGSKAFSGNDQLGQPQTITTGERVAYYLQSLLSSAGAILETKESGDLLSPGDVFRIGVTYDPVLHVIEISMVGNQGDPQKAREKLEMVQKLVMTFNKKLQRNFGVTLALDDLSMDYLNAKVGKIVVKYRNGKFIDLNTPKEGDVTPGVTPTP